MPRAQKKPKVRGAGRIRHRLTLPYGPGRVLDRFGGRFLFFMIDLFALQDQHAHEFDPRRHGIHDQVQCLFRRQRAVHQLEIRRQLEDAERGVGIEALFLNDGTTSAYS